MNTDYIMIRDWRVESGTFFTAADEVKWRRTVVPGDQVRMEVELLKEKRGLCVVKGEATVEGQLACSATVKFMVQQESADQG